MKLTLINLVLILSIFSSCSLVNKNITKSKDKTKTETRVSTATTVTTAASSTVASTRTIVEESDTAQVIKGSVITATGTASALDTGGVIKSETEDQVIEIKKDPRTGVITAAATVKDRKVNARRKKVTIENVEALSNFVSGSRVDQSIQQTKKVDTSSAEKTVSRQPAANLFALGFFSCLFLVIVLLLTWWYVKGRGWSLFKN